MSSKEVVLLLAEDDRGHALLLKKILKKLGIINPILHFKDGQECFDFLFQKENGNKRKLNTSYILLLDIRMPKMDGITLLRHIKKDKNLCKIPVIMLTTTNDPEIIELCYELRCNNYLTKPVDHKKLMAALHQLNLNPDSISDERP